MQKSRQVKIADTYVLVLGTGGAYLLVQVNDRLVHGHASNVHGDAHLWECMHSNCEVRVHHPLGKFKSESACKYNKQNKTKQNKTKQKTFW
jgi:hypothetical protein